VYQTTERRFAKPHPEASTMAYIRKTRGMLRMEQAYGISDIRTLLLQSYARHNTIKAVAREFKVSEQTMSAWFRQLGLHTRSSLPAMSIPQDLGMDAVTTDSGWSGDFEDAVLDDDEDAIHLRLAARLESPVDESASDGETAAEAEGSTDTMGALDSPLIDENEDDADEEDDVSYLRG
jgi:transposase-like protein